MEIMGVVGGKQQEVRGQMMWRRCGCQFRPHRRTGVWRMAREAKAWRWRLLPRAALASHALRVADSSLSTVFRPKDPKAAQVILYIPQRLSTSIALCETAE